MQGTETSEIKRGSAEKTKPEQAMLGSGFVSQLTSARQAGEENPTLLHLFGQEFSPTHQTGAKSGEQSVSIDS
ncbi:hypothetical protein EAW52_08475 [Pseudomonas sp. LTJR-52]|nr:hypothetical protein EAW52_08475 [Pseudomonas sp. LTJR-52]